MTALTLAVLVVITAAYGWPAGALAALAAASTFIATINAAEKERRIMAEHDTHEGHHRPSETHPGVLRRRAARLAQLGIIRSCEADSIEAPRTYTLVTAAGDVVEVARRDMPAYLSGLQHGHHAAQAGGR